MATKAELASGKLKTKAKVRSGRGAKAKGSDYERECAAYVNAAIPGLDVRRALLSGGGRNDGGMDVEGMPLVHPELKRTETFSPYAAMHQAEEAISKGKHKSLMPVVIQRRNHMATGKSLVVMRLDDWIAFYRNMLRSAGMIPSTISGTAEDTASAAPAPPAESAPSTAPAASHFSGGLFTK